MATDGARGPDADSAARAIAWPHESPCIKVCQIDLHARCYGCGRTLDEIAAWRTMTLDQRRDVNARVGFRGHGDNR